MRQYVFSLMVQIEVEAPDASDARDLVDDFLGSSAVGSLEVMSHEILDQEELD